eukprot:CFRG0643T1
MSIVIKLKFGEDTRRWQADRSFSWDQLSEKVSNLFGLCGAVIRYVDCDGDRITVSTDEELDLMKKEMIFVDSFALLISENNSPKSATPSPPAVRAHRALSPTRKDSLPGIAANLSVEAVEAFSENAEDQIIQMLRDISIYICAREGIANEQLFKEVASKKNLMTNRADAHGENVLLTTQVRNWKTSQVRDWLSGTGLSDFGPLFEENEIDGDALLAMDHETLKSMGVVVAGKRVKIIKLIKTLKMVMNAPAGVEAGGT